MSRFQNQSLSEIPAINAKEQKEAERELKKYQTRSATLLEKARQSAKQRSFFAHYLIPRFFISWLSAGDLQKALRKMQESEWDSAEALLNCALRRTPEIPELWLNLGQIALERKNYDQALARALCVLELLPSDSSESGSQISDHENTLRLEAFRICAKSFGEKKRFTASLSCWISVVRQKPQDASANFYVGVTYNLQNESTQGLPFLRRAVELDSSNVIYEMMLAKTLLNLGHNEEAGNHFRSGMVLFQIQELTKLTSQTETQSAEQKDLLIRKHFQENSVFNHCYRTLLLGLGTTESLLGRPEEALRQASKLLELDPENLEGRILAATSEYELKNWKQALEIFEGVLKTNSALGLPHWYCGDILFQQKKFEEALPHLKKALELRFRPTDSVYRILDCLQAKSQPREMVQFCTEVLSSYRKMSEVYHARGVARFALLQLADAVQDLRQAVKLSPTRASAWKDLAFVLYSGGQFQEALEALSRLEKMNLEEKDAVILKAACLRFLEHLPEAEACVNQYLKKYPETADAHILKAQILQEQGDLNGSTASFTDALRLAPSHPLALSGRASSLALGGDVEGALKDCTEALKANPKTKRLLLMRSSLNLQLKNFAAAMEDCRTLLEEYPELPEAWIARGNVHLEQQRPEAAILDYQNAMNFAPRSALPLFKRAKAKMTLGLMDPALLDLEKALKLQPDDTELQMHKTVLLTLLDRNEEALEYCTKLVQKYPNNLRLHFQRGSILMGFHLVEEALAEFDIVVEKDPNTIEPHFARALVLNALFRHQEALEELDRVLEFHPDFVPALTEKAMIFSTQGKMTRAMKLMEEILQIEPENVRILNFRGTVLANTNFHKEAMADFRRVIEIQPNYAPAHNNLGHLLALWGKLDEGMEELCLAIENAPDWPRPYLNRAILFMKMKVTEMAEEDIQQALRIAQQIGDEDTIVDALDLRRRLNLLKNFMEKLEEINAEADEDSEDEDGEEYGQFSEDEDDEDEDEDFFGYEDDDDDDDNDEVDDEDENEDDDNFFGDDEDSDEDDEDENGDIEDFDFEGIDGIFGFLENDPDSEESDDSETDEDSVNKDETEDIDDDEFDGSDTFVISEEFNEVIGFFDFDEPDSNSNVGKNLWPTFVNKKSSEVNSVSGNLSLTEEEQNLETSINNFVEKCNLTFTLTEKFREILNQFLNQKENKGETKDFLPGALLHLFRFLSRNESAQKTKAVPSSENTEPLQHSDVSANANSPKSAQDLNSTRDAQAQPMREIVLINARMYLEEQLDSEDLASAAAASNVLFFSDDSEKFFQNLTRISEELTYESKNSHEKPEKQRIRMRKRSFQKLMENVMFNLLSPNPSEMILLMPLEESSAPQEE